MSVDIQLNNTMQGTRIISGAGVTINADTTKFNIEFVGKIKDPLTFVETEIVVAQNGVSATHIATQVESYVWVDSSSTIVQSLTPPSPLLFDTILGYWVLVHSNLTNINVINPFPMYSDGVAIQLHHLLDFVGFKKYHNSNVASAGTTGTRLSHTGGLAIKLSGGGDTKRPVFNMSGATDPSNMEMRHRNGVSSIDVLNVDLANINLSGSTLTALGNNKFGAHKIWKFSSGLIRVQYGQKEYANYNEAILGINTDSFVDEGNASRNGVQIGWLIFKKNTTWGTGGTGVDGIDYKFIDTNSTGSSGGFTPNKQAVYDVSSQPQTTVNDTKGADQWKNVRSDQTSSTMEWLNEDDEVTAKVSGDGRFSAVKTFKTFELIGALTTDYYASSSFSVSAVTNVVNAPTTTLTLNGSAYTLGNPIVSGDKLTVTVSVAAVVKLSINNVI